MNKTIDHKVCNCCGNHAYQTFHLSDIFKFPPYFCSSCKHLTGFQVWPSRYTIDVHHGTPDIIASSQLSFLKNRFNLDQLNVADIGCGSGHLLSLLRQENCNIVGYEVNSKLINSLLSQGFVVNNLNSYKDIIKSLELSYDLSIISHVIEHLENPIELIKTVSKFSNKIFIEVPNCSPLTLQHLLQGKGQHVGFYSYKSLHSLIKRAGLNINEMLLCGTIYKNIHDENINIDINRCCTLDSEEIDINNVEYLWIRTIVSR